MQAHLIHLDILTQRLKLAKRTLVRTFAGHTRNGSVSSVVVVNMLNDAARCGEPTLDFIPSDIITVDEAARTLFPDSPFATSKVIYLLKSKRVRPIPHFYLSRHAIRFRKSSIQSWITYSHEPAERTLP